jgi:membrane associated rhomboid family serine protease
MERPTSDPVDHARTTRKHAGESMKYGANAFGLILIAIAVVAVVVSLSAFAVGNPLLGTVAALVALIGFIAGAAWLGWMHRRVRVLEEHHAAQQPGVNLEPPTS